MSSNQNVEQSFDRLFKSKMKGGTPSSFKRRYKTLYNEVILPLAEQMYKEGQESVNTLKQ